MNNTARTTAATMPTAIRKTRTTKHTPRLVGEPFDPAKVSTRLSVVVARNVRDEAARVDRKMGRLQPVPMQQVPVNVPLSSLGLGHTWSEAALSDCDYGCKVYEHDLTGERVVAHHAAYGCRYGA